MQLRRELKKKSPFVSPQEEALLNLWRTHDRFQIQFVRFFRDFGLTSSQYNVLRILRGEGKPLPCLEIADRLITPVPAITGLIDRLETAELIARERSADDRRIIYVAIRPKGLELVARMDGPLAELHVKLIGHLEHSELITLSRLLEKARDQTATGQA
jgi:DNA-binding MarR family transcriptional regulator